jgi:hypothetical protein
MVPFKEIKSKRSEKHQSEKKKCIPFHSAIHGWRCCLDLRCYNIPVDCEAEKMPGKTAASL